jgi:hypothetical protein
MAEAQGLVLADIGDGARFHVGRAQGLQKRVLAGLLQVRLQLVAVVEVILEGALAARGHEDELFDPGRARLVDGILDERPVDESQDFLRDALGGRQEARSEPCDRKDRLRHLASHV